MTNDPLSEEWLRRRVWPRFSRVRKAYPKIYLANHSMGRPPDRMAADVQHALDVWYHDMDEACRMGSRVAVMNEGRMLQLGTPQELIEHPHDAFVAGMLKGISVKVTCE